MIEHHGDIVEALGLSPNRPTSFCVNGYVGQLVVRSVVSRDVVGSNPSVAAMG